MPRENRKRNICFVTGTRAEFGLMRSTLAAIRKHPRLSLQLIATGTHLSAEHGNTLRNVREQGWKIDATVKWRGDGSTDETSNAIGTGDAIAKLAQQFERLKSDVVLVVGDRVEAFAAAAAGHISGRIVAHIHGGDRALGQVDDSLRHAITKLAHLHFPATATSQQRLLKMGEDRWRVHRVGSPGIDGLTHAAQSWPQIRRALPKLKRGRYALLVLHPMEADETAEQRRAGMLLKAVRQSGIEHAVIVYPNNDPGYAGIVRCWVSTLRPEREVAFRNLDRGMFLGLLRDAAMIAGNSSSGIIEAASFGTPVIDIGPRQQGREHGNNVVHVAFRLTAIQGALSKIWNNGRPARFPKRNVYGGRGTGKRIAQVLAQVRIDPRLKRKLISY